MHVRIKGRGDPLIIKCENKESMKKMLGEIADSLDIGKGPTIA